MRIFTVVLSIILAILGCVLAVQYYQGASKAENDLHQERYLRMVAEEGLEEAKTKIQSLETEIARLKEKIANLDRIVTQEKAKNNSLKSRLDEALGAKKDLEKEVEALKRVSTQEM